MFAIFVFFLFITKYGKILNKQMNNNNKMKEKLFRHEKNEFNKLQTQKYLSHQRSRPDT